MHIFLIQFWILLRAFLIFRILKQHVFKRIYLYSKCSVCSLLVAFSGFQSLIDIVTGIWTGWAIWAFMASWDVLSVEHTFKYYPIIYLICSACCGKWPTFWTYRRISFFLQDGVGKNNIRRQKVIKCNQYFRYNNFNILLFGTKLTWKFLRNPIVLCKFL